MNRAAVCLSIVALALVSETCSPSADRDPLLGQWNGGWTSGQVAGSLQVTFSDRQGFGDMALYSVDILVTGTSCPPEGDRAAASHTAAFRLGDLSFAVQFQGGQPGVDEGVFEFDGGVSGNQVSGGYQLLSDACPQCTCLPGGSGTWQATR
jgi:hypothetical protein